MRKRTFQDRKFSQGNSNSDAYRDNWERMFGNRNSTELEETSDLPSPRATPLDSTGQTE